MTTSQKVQALASRHSDFIILQRVAVSEFQFLRF